MLRNRQTLPSDLNECTTNSGKTLMVRLKAYIIISIKITIKFLLHIF